MAIPKRFKKFTEDHPEVASSYEALGNAVHKAGPLGISRKKIISK